MAQFISVILSGRIIPVASTASARRESFGRTLTAVEPFLNRTPSSRYRLRTRTAAQIPESE